MSANTDAVVAATIPDSYFDRIGLDPEDVKGYIDDTELPLGQGVDTETYSFAKVEPEGYINSAANAGGEYVIHSDQWSTHDIGFGVVPEPMTISLLALGAMGMLARKRR